MTKHRTIGLDGEVTATDSAITRTGAPVDQITVSKSAIFQAVTEALLEAFPGSPYGEPRLSESRARWIADQALQRLE